jgi:soluble lytic murein transglycosylase-like protein
MTTSEKTILILATTAGALFSSAAHAYCFEEASKRYSISEQLLRAIARVESNTNGAAMNMGHLGRTGSYDIGLMQINSSWLPKLRTFGINEQALKDPCQNLMVGAWILAHHMREDGADWNGVGAYNASCRGASPAQCAVLRNTYTNKVYAALTAQSSQNTQSRPSNPGRQSRASAPVVAQAQAPAPRSIRSVEEEI